MKYIYLGAQNMVELSLEDPLENQQLHIQVVEETSHSYSYHWTVKSFVASANKTTIIFMIFALIEILKPRYFKIYNSKNQLTINSTLKIDDPYSNILYPNKLQQIFLFCSDIFSLCYRIRTGCHNTKLPTQKRI